MTSYERQYLVLSSSRFRGILPVYAEWTLLPLLFGPVHFQYKGCLVSFYYNHVL